MSHGWIKERFLRDGAVSARAIADGAVGRAALEESIEQRVRVTLTPAQILALNATPITLIPAPGADKIIVPVMMQLWLEYNSAAYTVAVGEDLQFSFTDAAGPVWATVETTGFLDVADSTRVVVTGSGDATVGGAGAYTIYFADTNQPFVVSMLTGEAADGDSPIHIEIIYRVLDINIDLPLE